MNDKIARLIYLLAKSCLLVEESDMFAVYDMGLRSLTADNADAYDSIESFGIGIEELLTKFAYKTIDAIKDDLTNVFNALENDNITFEYERHLYNRYSFLTGLMDDLQEVIK